MNLRDAILNAIADHGDDLTIDQIEIITTAVVETPELRQALEDAERYRWLQDSYTVTLLSGKVLLRIVDGVLADSIKEIDSVIDKARGK